LCSIGSYEQQQKFPNECILHCLVVYAILAGSLQCSYA
jgi:hypothetical protein